MSYCYLLCFGQPIGNPNSRHGQATHYLGFTSKSLKQRLEQHRSGAGAKICRAAALDYGRELKLVRHWRNGTRALERELKRRHNPKHYCPLCNKTITLLHLVMTSCKFKPNAETAQQKREQALDKLSQGITQLLNSGDWHKYLQTQARFHRYSFNNCMLILMQRPDAAQVAGFNTWKQMGRNVRKGEKGISILAPLVRSVESSEDGSTERTLSGFRTVAVFDIAQTEGAPLLEVCHVLQGDDQGLFNLLQAFATNIGIPVNVKEIAANGLCQYAQGKPIEIAINEKLAPLHKAKSLAHELAHAIAHNPKEYGEHRGDMELEAESTAYVILNHFGLDSAAYSFGYIADWQKDADKDLKGTVEQIKSSAQVIHKASFEVINWIESQAFSADKRALSSS